MLQFLISLAISFPYFYFPTTITLNNKNIFVIHKTGITICDSSFKKIIKNIYDFPAENEQISTEDQLSKISIKKFDNGYIVSIIIDRIYIFDSEGNYLERSETLNSDNDIIFTFTTYKIENNYYFF